MFIRHGDHSLLNRCIAGRMPNVHLSEEGQKQAAELSDRLAELPIMRIYASPLERTQETAAPAAQRLGLQVQVTEDVTELDFGDWTGMDLDVMHRLPAWQAYNTFRCGTRIPNGELMPEVQTRMVRFVETLCEECPTDLIAIFSHSDPIKCALAYYLGSPLDMFLRIELFPASVSIVEIGIRGPRVLCVNHTESVHRLAMERC